MNHSAIIFIDGLTIGTVIGAYDWERNVRQEIQIDLRLTTDIAAAAASDALEDAPVDYAKVAQRVQEIADDTAAQLVEHLAQRLAEQLLAELPITRVELTITKPTAISHAQGVGVQIVRTAGDGLRTGG